MRVRDNTVDWSHPPPRRGWRGWWDRLVGPGATQAEQGVTLAAGGVGALGVVFHAAWHQLPWAWWEYAIAFVIALDIVGGVFANATSSAKRWHHRAGQSGRQHFGFLALHGVHITLVASLFGDSPVTYGAVSYGYLLLAGIAILAVPLHLQRPTGQLAACGGIFLAVWGLPEIPGWEWFLPVLVIKLITGHATLETPFVTQSGLRR